MNRKKESYLNGKVNEMKGVGPLGGYIVDKSMRLVLLR